MSNGPLFQITEQPFIEWAETLEEISRDLEEQVSCRMAEAMGEFAELVREAIRAHPEWPNEAADAVTVEVIDGEFEIDIAHPDAERLELGGLPHEAAAPIFRTLALQREAWFDGQLSAAALAALGAADG